MEKQIYIEKPDGFFGYIVGHFFIDCVCGNFLGSHFEVEGDPEFTDTLQSTMNLYKSQSNRKTKHTLYMNSSLFVDRLSEIQLEGKVLNVICNSCNKKFPFTLDRYHKLRKEIFFQDGKI
ncbi:MAG TPA: hypothetical protein VMZ91_14595 [Candidatus Paceibacterota bacterium]|nr:hypothetical protein [Candidatus Paceibacterota bacterium]